MLCQGLRARCSPVSALSRWTKSTTPAGGGLGHFRSAMGERQSTSSDPFAVTESDCKHAPCRLRIDAVANDRRFVALEASGTNEQRVSRRKRRQCRSVPRMREPGLGGRFSAIQRVGRDERMIARSDGRGADLTGRECDPGVDFVRAIQTWPRARTAPSVVGASSPAKATEELPTRLKREPAAFSTRLAPLVAK